MYLDGHRLAEDYGKALLCQERALFYGVNDTLITAIGKVKHPPRRPPRDPIQLEFVLLGHITSIYADAIELLTDRLLNVSSVFYTLRREFERNWWYRLCCFFKWCKPAQWSDRHEKASVESRETVIRRCKVLARSARFNNFWKKKIHEFHPLNNLDELVASCRNTWQGIDNICRLIMDEITHFTSRIDSLNSSLSSRTSLRWAILALIVGAGIASVGSYLSLGYTIFGFGKKGEPPPSVPLVQPVEPLHNVLEDIRKEISNVAAAIQAWPEAKENASDLKERLARVEEKLKMFGEQVPAQIWERLGRLEERVKMLREQEKKTPGALDVNIKEVPKAIADLPAQMERVISALSDLAQAVKDQKPPQVDVHVPAQKPPKVDVHVPPQPTIKGSGIGSFRQEQPKPVENRR